MNIELKKLFNKNDIVLIAFILLVAIFGAILIFSQQAEGDRALIFVNGKLYNEYNLSENKSYTVDLGDGSYNEFIIEDGYVDMIGASCPDQICVNHKKISMSGETIVCAPNRLVIEIKSKSKSDIDAIVN